MPNINQKGLYMKFNLDKTTILELSPSQLGQVAGGTNSYNTCAGTCGCPTTCDTSVNCGDQSNRGGCGTTTKCNCPTPEVEAL